MMTEDTSWMDATVNGHDTSWMDDWAKEDGNTTSSTTCNPVDSKVNKKTPSYARVPYSKLRHKTSRKELLINEFRGLFIKYKVGRNSRHYDGVKRSLFMFIHLKFKIYRFRKMNTKERFSRS
jgi:hypothetical protein